MRVTDLLELQHGVAARSQLLELGMSDSSIRHRVGAGGRWQRLLPGIYLATTGTPTCAQKWQAALLHGGPDSMLGGLTALRLHGLEAAPDRPHVRLLVPHERPRASVGFVAVRLALSPPPPVRVDEWRAVPVERAVIDGCREIHDLRTVRAVVAESVQRELTCVDALVDQLEAGASAGSRLVRAALAEVADGTRSTIEAEARGAVLGAGLPPARFNWHLYDEHGQWIAQPDGWFDDVAVAYECDSARWHRTPEGWERSTLRIARMSAYGILVVPATTNRIRRQTDHWLTELRAACASGAARPRPPIVARPPEEGPYAPGSRAGR